MTNKRSSPSNHGGCLMFVAAAVLVLMWISAIAITGWAWRLIP